MNLKHIPPASFFQSEVRNGYTVTEEMKKVWACQLDLLQELLEVCNKYNLKCFADSGTLIGAIRDKGYIPGDDDIDMAMLREDFDKLAEVADQEFKAPYFFQTIYSDRHYTHRHAQLRNCDTAAYKESFTKRKMRCNNGIFVDIFILDTLPATPRLYVKHIKKIRRAKLKLKIVSKFINRLPENIYRCLRDKTKCLSDSYLYSQYENLVRNVPADRSRLVCLICLRMNIKVKDSNDYKEVLYKDFEYIKIPVPCGYDNILKTDYGNYMVPVKIPTTHGEMLFNTEKSYKDIEI